MGDYTPTTEEVREYVANGGEYQPWTAPDEAVESARTAAFDRWLAAEKAQAWSEGFGVGERSGVRELPLNPWTENPYRIERGDA